MKEHWVQLLEENKQQIGLGEEERVQLRGEEQQAGQSLPPQLEQGTEQEPGKQWEQKEGQMLAKLLAQPQQEQGEEVPPQAYNQRQQKPVVTRTEAPRQQ